VAGEAAGGRLSGQKDGERDLARLLKFMAPRLHDAPYVFRLLAPAEAPPSDAFALIAEEEGRTLIVPAPGGAWARISLTVHSDLEAVGLTAALAKALAEAGISANVVAGWYHDHIFVPWARRHDALGALAKLGDDA
jgi:hypothetical protein